MVALAASDALAGGGDQVFHLTAHGNQTTGVARLSSVPTGHCTQCHPTRQTPAPPSPTLFSANDNGLCFTCHMSPGRNLVYAGQTAFASSSHQTSTSMRWPGPVPAARPAGDAGKCVNCHTPHGSRDGLGLVPNLEFFREEALCLACHDGSGPASTNVAAEVAKARAHPVTTTAGVHATSEGIAPASFAARHAECTDCHNPHAARSGAVLSGTSRVQVTNGAAGTVPTYTAVPASNTGPVREYELCFKCHSSWTTRPAGQTDLAVVLNPANESFHPIEGPGRNSTSTMSNSLDGGSGLPRLSTNSVITCADCHNSDALPRTVSVASAYTGTVPSGPHGSNASTANAALSGAILRAPYRVALKPRANSNDFQNEDFGLCFICHGTGPFRATNENARNDTSFRYHAFHLNRLFNQGSGAGDINTPGAGMGNAICRECHYNTHGNKTAPFSQNRGYAKGVAFSPNVTGPGGTGQPTWTPGSCSLRCHGMNHNPETY